MGPGGRGNFTHELSHSTGGNFTAPRLFPPPVGWRGAPYPTGGKLFTQDNLIIPGMENYTQDHLTLIIVNINMVNRIVSIIMKKDMDLQTT